MGSTFTLRSTFEEAHLLMGENVIIIGKLFLLAFSILCQPVVRLLDLLVFHFSVQQSFLVTLSQFKLSLGIICKVAIVDCGCSAFLLPLMNGISGLRLLKCTLFLMLIKGVTQSSRPVFPQSALQVTVNLFTCILTWLWMLFQIICLLAKRSKLFRNARFLRIPSVPRLNWLTSWLNSLQPFNTRNTFCA